MDTMRRSQLHPRVDQNQWQYGAVLVKRRAAILAAGAVAYRNEFDRDYGPDLDEPQDAVESGQERWALANVM